VVTGGGVERDQLTRALERRSVVQGTLLRSTIHLVSARDYWPLALAVREGRRRWWLRAVPNPPSERELAAAARRLRDRLGDGPLRRAEVEQVVGKGRLLGAGLWLELVRVPPSGTWERRRADLFHAAEEWLGAPSVSPDEATDRLVRRYLGGFGPASANDIAGWAGIPVAEIEPALGRLSLRRFLTEAGEELLDLPRAPLPDPDTPAPPRLLPTWDATLLAHARRAGILPEEYRPRVFHTKMPQSIPTFLIDGVVAGTWRYREERIALDPFERIAASTRRALEEEAERLAAFHG
jgi:hypothetical protein